MKVVGLTALLLFNQCKEFFARIFPYEISSDYRGKNKWITDKKWYFEKYLIDSPVKRT